MPIISGILGALAVGSGIAGTVEAGKTAGAQQKALSIQDQIAQQQMQDKQQIFQQLVPFFSQYLNSGSPFLAQIQRAAGETNAQQFNNAAGAVRQNMTSSGLGFGPSGTTAAELGNLATSAAQTGSSDYLSNLLNNETLKFQAAQGLNSAGSMVGAGQNQPNVSTQIPSQSIGSSILGLSQVLQSLLNNNSSNSAINTLGAGKLGIPQPGTVPTSSVPIDGTLTPPGVPNNAGGLSSTPATQGWTL